MRILMIHNEENFSFYHSEADSYTKCGHFVYLRRFNNESLSHGTDGLELTLVATDSYLNVDQIMYLLTRLRSPNDESDYASPTHHKICLWLDAQGLNLGIGLNTITLGGFSTPRSHTSDEMRYWIENSLEDTFE